MTWRIDTLGSILLHEYTHFAKLVKPILDDATDDHLTSVYSVRHVDKALATNNADSYAIFANELF